MTKAGAAAIESLLLHRRRLAVGLLALEGGIGALGLRVGRGGEGRSPTQGRVGNIGIAREGDTARGHGRWGGRRWRRRHGCQLPRQSTCSGRGREGLGVEGRGGVSGGVEGVFFFIPSRGKEGEGGRRDRDRDAGKPYAMLEEAERAGSAWGAGLEEEDRGAGVRTTLKRRR